MAKIITDTEKDTIKRMANNIINNSIEPIDLNKQLLIDLKAYRVCFSLNGKLFYVTKRQVKMQAEKVNIPYKIITTKGNMKVIQIINN